MCSNDDISEAAQARVSMRQMAERDPEFLIRLGIGEVARMLHISRQRVYQIAIAEGIKMRPIPNVIPGRVPIRRNSPFRPNATKSTT